MNASLIVRRRTVPLAISADLSTHLLEVCLDVRKNISLPLEDSLLPDLPPGPTDLFARLLSSIPVLLHPLPPKKPH